MKKMFASLRRFSRSRKLPTKTVSLLLTLILTFLAVPTVVFAEAAEAIGSASSNEASEDANADIYSYVGETYEVTELREESAKHFRLSDGRYVAAQYGEPVHYIDENGNYIDISNKLSRASGGVYTNESARIKFAKKINGSTELFALHDGSTKLTLSLIGAIKGTKGKITNYEDDRYATELQKMMNLEELSASVLYEDILDGVDLEYIAHSLNVKENIIVKERKDSYSYSFELSLNGLEARLLENGDVAISYPDGGEVKYTIPAPVVFDAESAYAPAGIAAYTLTDHGNKKYTLTVTVSAEWMNADERVFPVTVDPAVVAVGAGNAVIDTYISVYQPSSSFGSSQTLCVDITGSIAFLKVGALPTLPASAYISDASISMTVDLHDGYYIAAYEVLTAWDESLTWNKHKNTTAPEGQLGEDILDYRDVSSGDHIWIITEAVRGWYSAPNYNYGIAFSYLENHPVGAVIHSIESTTVSDRPYLTVTYRNMMGVEDYFAYSSHTAGAAGSGSINLATGQLTLAIPTLSTTDSLMPYTPTLVYNSALANKGYVYPNVETADEYTYTPYGFKLNINETVLLKRRTLANGSTELYYVYADADGSEHSFYQSVGGHTFVDSDGMQKILTAPDGYTIQITDDSNWIRIFSLKSIGTPTISYCPFPCG